MDQRIPELIRPLLENYLARVNEHLPGVVSGFYITGSIALDGFNELFSDIDFVAVLTRKINREELLFFEYVHKEIAKEFPRWQLSGIYLQKNDLGRSTGEVEPYPYYQEGILQPAGYFELNRVTWWILKNHGIPLTGPEPEALPFTVEWSLLISEMYENLNSYWFSWTRQPPRLIMLLSDWGIHWAVLGILRQFYTFRENGITTKEKAGEYALTCLPTCWHPLIQEALELRAGRRRMSHRSRLLRMMEAVRFLKIIIRLCNEQFT